MTLKINKSRAALSRTKSGDFAMAADTLSLDRNEWYADSGATHHMCHDKSLMHNFKSIPGLSWEINGIGGVSIYALGQGDIHVVTTVDGATQTGVLNNVLYVPDLGTNLFSIASATDQGLNLEFLKQTVLFKSNGTTILSGHGGRKALYKLNISATAISSLETQSNALKAFEKRVPLSTWHQRLSHTSYSAVIRMMKVRIVNGMDFEDSQTTHNGMPWMLSWKGTPASVYICSNKSNRTG